MPKKVRILEQKVTQVVQLLGDLRVERDRLDGELASARLQLEESPSASDPVRLAAAERWEERRTAALTLVRETLDELRGDSPT